MWIENADSVAEIFRGWLPYYLLIILPVFIIISPVNPVAGSHEFAVYRMQHYDLHGVPHGCRSAQVNLEARSLTGWSTSRHCVVTWLNDLTIERFRDIKTKAGALLAMLPKNFSDYNNEDKQQLMTLEDSMMIQDVVIPVYFAKYSPALEEIISDIADGFVTDKKGGTAVDALVTSISANGYQIVISPGATKVKQDNILVTLQGKLSGVSADGKIPTIALVAHYDSFGVAPELSFGADSNGSGVTLLLELARLFSHLYSNPKTQGKYNILFLLSSGGKFNYQGSKKWLEDQLDSLDGSIIQDASFVLCLDTLAAANSLYMHVSKPPKDGTAAAQFFKDLKAAADRYPSVTVEGVHKKINLAEEMLAWEHERFSIRRLSAFTLSSLKSHRDLLRRTILDTKDSVNFDNLIQNINIVAEALGRFVYNYSASPLFGGHLKVEPEAVESVMNLVSSQPRSVQLLMDKQNTIVPSFKLLMNKYLKDVKVNNFSPDKREPEFTFYEVTSATMNVYNVKPAVFDLVLTIAITLYLISVYQFIQVFPKIYKFVFSFSESQRKVKSN